MATGGTESAKADNRVNKLTCAICLETFRQPKLLPCFHTFCQKCVQDVAGSSHSFPCPSCRTLVLLPPRGVEALQTNFYIEEDLNADQPLPPPRLCDVCSEDREATHKCQQCQQRFCLPCRKVHDAISLSHGHTVVPLAQCNGDGLSGKVDEYQKIEMCPKHPNQQLLLHCNKCEADICLHCKLTLHEGHPTEDLAVARAKVKAKLQDKLGTLTQEIHQLDDMIGAFDDRCTKLQQQEQTREQEFQGRAETLRQWVNQSLEEAINSLQSSTKELAKSWQDQAEQLRSKNSALKAQRDHVMRVLKDGTEVDIVSLEAQLPSSPLDDVDVKQMEQELSNNIPTFHVEHNANAVTQILARSYVGVVKTVHETPDPETSDSTGKSVSSDNAMKTKQKEPPREISYSKNPRSSLVAMCPISGQRIWVRYKPGGFAGVMKLFDAEGQILSTAICRDSYDRCTPIDGDNVLSWQCNKQLGNLIKPDGSVQSSKVANELHCLISRASSGKVYLKRMYSEVVTRVKFTVTDKLHCAEAGYAFKIWGHPQHVSADGQYCAVIETPCSESQTSVVVYLSGGTSVFSSYTPNNPPTDAHFCQIDGQERLLVTVVGENKVHIVDVANDGFFLRYLDTSPLKLDRPYRLATDLQQRLWIGCHGGSVVQVHL